MPIFDYVCADCERIFDIYHRGKEEASKVKCPSCGSTRYRKLVSVPSAVGGKQEESHGRCEPGAMGGCCGGMCGLN